MLEISITRFAAATLIVFCCSACDNGHRDIGNVILHGNDEVQLSAAISRNVTGWRFRFGLVPYDQEKSLKNADKVVIYLQNEDKESLDFYVGRDDPRLTIPPGEKVPIFKGSIHQLLTSTGGSEESMSIYSTKKRKVNLKLFIVPQLEEDATYTLHISLFYPVEGW